MTECEHTPMKGQDGNYQVRIESYDPARNTMKAIWLVSRNQRLLSQLLEKCEVSNNETSNEARGNLLSVQRELQEIRDAMDRNDGTQTPVLNASCLGMGNDPSMFSGRDADDAYSLTPTPVPTEDLFQAERASSSFGFGSHRRKSVLSQIPRRPRPSIRTDFCVSTFDPFPTIRARPSKIPKPPPMKKKKKGKKSAKNKPALVRSKTSLGRHGVTRYGMSGKQSSLKGIPMSARPATSMALTRSMTKKVSFGDSLSARPKQARTRTPMEKKYAKVTVRPSTSLGIRSMQRAASSASGSSVGLISGRRSSVGLDSGRRSVGLNSGRRSSVGLNSGISSVGSQSGRRSSVGLNSGIRSVGSHSGRRNSVGTTPSRSSSFGGASGRRTSTGFDSGRRSSFGGPAGRRTSIGLDSGRRSSCALDSGKKSIKGSSRRGTSMGMDSGLGRRSSLGMDSTSTKRRPNEKLRKSQSTNTYSDRYLAKKENSKGSKAASKSKIKEGANSKITVKSRGIHSTPQKSDSSARIRPASAIPGVLPEVLPFDSPPPVPKLISQPCSLTGSALLESRHEDTASPVIRSISIIDDASELSASIEDTRRTLPRIRIGDGDRPEYKVKAYFLDDEIDDFPTPPVLNSGVIPSSPVEVDSAHARDHQRSRADAVSTVSNKSPFKNSAKSNNEEISKRTMERESMLDRDYQDAPCALDLGSEYLPEFESEVHGLLDTLMSQDLLTSSFSQDLRLFSTESNFMEEHHSKDGLWGDNKLDAREVDSKDIKTTTEPATNAAGGLLRKGDGTSLVDETENNDDVVFNNVDSQKTTETSGVESRMGMSVNCEEIQKMPIGDALRRKSTGSYDATVLSKSVAAALKPQGHRRSASQSELDAMLTNNDGYERQPPSPGNVGRGAVLFTSSGRSI